MEIHVTVNYAYNDPPAKYTSDQIAQRVLVALGGDPTKDVCYAQVTPIHGQAGTPPTVGGTP